jgi:hypothetical protein
MKKQYNVETIDNHKVIWYEEDGVRVSFVEDLANSDYQEYLKSLDEAATL